MVNDTPSDGNAAEPCAPATNPPLTPKGASRRRIAGLGVTGVVMTVASNHAMAALVCKSPSGALSGNLNSHSPKLTCNGRSPQYWIDNPSQWPKEIKGNDRFGKHFDTHTAIANQTCMKVLKEKGSGHSEVASLIMATYLNVLSGRITFLTRQAVLEMWAQWEDDKQYKASEGAVAWSAGEFADYLASTQVD